MRNTTSQSIEMQEIKTMVEKISKSMEESKQLSKEAKQMLYEAKLAREAHDAEMRQIKEKGSVEIQEIRQIMIRTAIASEKASKKHDAEMEKLRQADIRAQKEREESSKKFDAEMEKLRQADIRAQKEREESSKKFDAEMEKFRQMQEESSKKHDAEMAELHQLSKARDKALTRLETLFVGQWGKLMESLVKGDLIKLLQEKGIKVNRFHTETTADKRRTRYQFDIIAIDGAEMVVIEVKTTLNQEEAEYFVGKLKKFKELFPEYKDKTIYGAVAYLKVNQSADVWSQKKGLFVIRATGSSASIVNTGAFKPKAF